MFKKDKKIDFINYWPNSLLPVVSKIIEKSVHYQLENHLQKNGLLYKYQSGFRDILQWFLFNFEQPRAAKGICFIRHR